MTQPPVVHTVARQPETLVSVRFSSDEDMLYALRAAKDLGYTGEVALYRDNDQQPVYRLRLNNIAQGDQFGYVGDWSVLHVDNKIELLIDTDFQALYTVQA